MRLMAHLASGFHHYNACAGTSLMMKLSAVSASYNIWKSLPHDELLNTQHNPLYRTTADITSPKIPAAHDGRSQQTSSIGLPLMSASSAWQAVMRKPSMTQFRSIWQSPFFPSPADTPQKLVVKVSSNRLGAAGPGACRTMLIVLCRPALKWTLSTIAHSPSNASNFSTDYLLVSHGQNSYSQLSSGTHLIL